ncbi:MAG TPA: hypothetical protein VF627_07880 [Abditibacterium sp.]
MAAASPSLAAPALPAAPGALSFRMTARVGAAGLNAGTEQTVQARVLLRGRAARVETNAGGSPTVVLFLPPYVYRLLPASKAGVRWKVDAKRPSTLSNFDAQSLLRDPARLKSALISGGAKKVGVGAIDKMPVDIYESQNFGRAGQRVKIWLRRTDSLPLRLEARGGELHLVASWRDYARPTRLPAALFAPPKGFRVREVAGPPPFSML